MDFIKRVFAGLLGGAIGGALIGVLEAAVVAVVSEASEYWAFVFGAISYGFFGAMLGAGWGFFSGVLTRSDERDTLATAGALAAALLGLVVARFRIVRDVFAESLPVASPTGIAVHLGIVVAAAVMFVALRRALRASAESRGPARVAARWLGASIGIAVVAAVALTTALGPGEPAEAGAPATAKGPNVILIIADTLRSDYVGAYNSANAKTPAMDRLARDGVVFESTFANSSWTRPSIATIMSSLHPASHSVMHKTDLLPEQVETLAEVMEAGGYRTAGFVTNINVAPSFNFDQGFATYRYLAPEFFFNATDSGSKLSLYSGMRLIRERFLSRKKWVQHYYQDAKTVEEQALPWLDGHAAEPYFVLIHYMDPHDPYFEIPYNGKAVARVDTPNPDPARAEELRRLYASNVEYMDVFIGKLIEGLEREKLYDDAVIALVADHGEEFHEHGGWWHGTTLYDEQLRLPFIVKLPKNQRAGQRVSDLTNTVDVMPTLLAAAGLKCAEACQGRDVFGSRGAPAAVYAEEDHEGNVLESVRTQEWKLIIANDGNPRGLAPVELYDLVKDPGERLNLAADAPDRVAALKRDLELLRQAAGASAVHGVEGAIDDAAKERLRALGYTGE